MYNVRVCVQVQVLHLHKRMYLIVQLDIINI